MSKLAAFEPRYEEYWDWVAVALFLLLTIDLLTSMYAAGVVGLEHESNPIMAWVLAQSLSVVVGVHLLAVVLVTSFFYALFELVRELPRSRRAPVAFGLELFLGLLIAAGLAVFANNLSVIILGESMV